MLVKCGRDQAGKNAKNSETSIARPTGTGTEYDIEDHWDKPFKFA